MKVLKDGRKLFTTHNGFRKFVQSKDKELVPVTDEYYMKALQHSVEEVPFKKRTVKKKRFGKF